MIKIKIKQFVKQNLVWQTMTLAILSVIASALIVYFVVPQSDDLLTLHYSIPFGIDLVGFWYQFYYFPIAGVIILVCNTLLAYFLANSHRTLSKTIVALTAIMEVIIFVSLVLIINQNTF